MAGASAQILADEILDHADWVFERCRTLVALRTSPVRGLAAFPFRRFFSNHHGPESFVPRLIITDHGDPDAVGLGLQEICIVARRSLPLVDRLGPSHGAGRYSFYRR